MSKSSVVQAVLKVLTLVVVAVLLYYTDPPAWISSLQDSPFLGLFVGGLTLLSYQVIMKRRVLSAYLDIGRGNLVLGLILLFATAATYVSGYYLGDTAWFHFQSLILLVASYICFRFDSRILKTLGLPLLMLGLAFPLPQLLQAIGYDLAIVYILVVAIGFSLLSAGIGLRTVLMSGLVGGLSVVYLLGPGYWILPYLIPLGFLLLVPSALHERKKLNIGGTFGGGTEAHQVEDGFCILCGRKMRSASRPVHFGLVGLVATLVVVYAIFSFQVPTLSYGGVTPVSDIYTRTGVTSTGIPQAPAGWVANSTTSLKTAGDLYSEEIVYVPSYHPETANYTLYFELSNASTPITNSWSEQPTWNFNGSVPLQVGSLSGHLLTYTSNARVMLLYAGNHQLYFQDGGNFPVLLIGMSIVRQFDASSVSEARSTFISDLNTLFVPQLGTYNQQSIWTDFLSKFVYAFQGLQTYLLLGSLSLVIAWGAYRALLYESLQQRFMTETSELNEAEWKKLSRLLGQSKRSRTGFEIARLAGPEGQEARTNETLAFLRRLEQVGVLRRVITERGSDVLLLWKLAR